MPRSLTVGKLRGLQQIASGTGMLYPFLQVTLRPEIGAIAMSGSSTIVAVNALLLKRLELDR